ncbi:lipid transfer-like protein VAS isoform X2 [Carica papaya]|uniref:lipid transfer-like protein VAS isoform X2 n=1 Tax=Carica papaya TaxID=3649 RepID=UPI000B8C6FE3|nr:lipid transfer-like protein VAS isoform X2 [Carica papaya]
MATAKLMIMAVAVALVVIGTAEAQTATCASKLVPCADFLNSTTKPPDTCCDPLKEAVANDLVCLCNLFNDPSFFSTFNVTVDEALRLAKNCGVTSDLSSCNAPSQTPSSVSPPGLKMSKWV